MAEVEGLVPKLHELKSGPRFANIKIDGGNVERTCPMRGWHLYCEPHPLDSNWDFPALVAVGGIGEAETARHEAGHDELNIKALDFIDGFFGQSAGTPTLS